LPAQLLVNGGYVRDLLLGKKPDDLDLSLCLRACAAEVTFDSVMKGIEAFVNRRPDLNVSSVNVTTILSDTSKDKNVDTAKAHLLVGSPPERIEVDFMPTIGEEQYDEFDRVPLRDVRGTAEQDALRRDLTIGAMMLEISRPPSEAPPARGGAADALAAAAGLRWTLLDYYGGLSDGLGWPRMASDGLSDGLSDDLSDGL
jgi:tRNA nucleotidyltransferase/poly(A) polymerase